MKNISNILFLLLALTVAHYGEWLLLNIGADEILPNVHFKWIKAVVHILILPLLLAAYFARDRIKSWFGQGRLRVDWAHLLVLVLLPLFFLQGLPFIRMMTGNLQLFSLLVLYNLLSAVYKEPLYLKAKPPTVQPPNP